MKDFHCQKSIMLTKMRYFDNYVQGAKSIHDLDISVHCDVFVFEWLMQFLHGPVEPRLELTNVISICISSEFLGIDILVENCIIFIAKHLSDIVNLPIDLNCLNVKIVRRLAEKVSIKQLSSLKDKKDKLLSKIYHKKLEALMQEHDATGKQLFRCVNCNLLYTEQQEKWMTCDKAKIIIDSHGEAISQHLSDKYFDMFNFFEFMKKEGLTWKQIFWKIWASMQTFKCSTCE